MNILFATIAFPETLAHRNIYTDLVEELRNRGHSIFVTATSERRYGKETSLSLEKDVSILRVKTWNLKKTKNPVEKGLGTFLVEKQFKNAINSFLKDIRFDLILYSTPPITFDGLIRYLKTKHSARTYLLLKDIFPQNAVDLGMMKPNSLLCRYFKSREKRLYSVSDFIGCMSPANKAYIEKHNRQLDPSKIEVCPNSVIPTDIFSISISDEARSTIRKKYRIPEDAVVFAYGGNLGKPQGISFLENVLKQFKGQKNVFFLIVGSGTEYDRLKSFHDDQQLDNMGLYPHLPKNDYDILLKACDVGLIFLDPRFTIPNFPSRLLAYMDLGKPVLAATDKNTDLGRIMIQGEFGLWCESRDTQAFVEHVHRLASDILLRNTMGQRARIYLEEHFTAARSADIILGHFE